MPFGKYSGHPIGDLPPAYLRWCLENLESMRPDIRAEMRRVLARDPTATTTTDVQPAAIVSQIDSELKSWYRSASLQYHPDRGGDTRGQIIVNAVFESLSTMLSRIGGAE